MADYNSSYTGAQIDANLAKAATATQPGDLGTAAFTASTAYATAAQGVLAGTAVQPGANANVLGSGSATDNFVLTANGSGGVAWEAAAGGSSVTDYLRTRLGTVQDVFNMADTWNAGATVFTGIKLNVTDTASAAGSLLMDLQVGGVSKFSVSKSGSATIPGDNTASLSIGGLSLGAAPTSARATGILFMRSGSEIQLSALSTFGWSSANNGVGTSDLILARDAANTLAQRNGVNAQAFNLYNTYTDASNYERGFMRWVGGVLQIGTEGLGTGIRRNVQLTGLNTTITYASSYEILIREDSTGRWRFNSSVFRPEVTNTNDIGLTSVRIRTLYAGTSVEAPRVTVDQGFTVATLPTPAVVGMMARVTDATSPVVGTTVTGGGAAAALCWYNGTNWTVIGA